MDRPRRVAAPGRVLRGVGAGRRPDPDRARDLHRQPGHPRRRHPRGPLHRGHPGASGPGGGVPRHRAQRQRRDPAARHRGDHPARPGRHAVRAALRDPEPRWTAHRVLGRWRGPVRREQRDHRPGRPTHHRRTHRVHPRAVDGVGRDGAAGRGRARLPRHDPRTAPRNRRRLMRRRPPGTAARTACGSSRPGCAAVRRAFLAR